jgi:hypothetical protein
MPQRIHQKSGVANDHRQTTSDGLQFLRGLASHCRDFFSVLELL